MATTALLKSHVASASRARVHAGFWTVAATFFTIMAFATVPTPLYALYERRDGFATAVVTVIFAAYAVGVVASLYLAGHVSDWLGRRPVILVAVGVEMLSAVLFLLWNDVPGLLAARFVNGVGVGLLTATATAQLAELGGRLHGPADRRAIVVANSANIGGLGAGSLIAALIAVGSAAPLVAPFVVFLVLFVLAGVAMLTVPETVTRRRVAYRPQRIAVPAASRGVFWAAAVATLGTFAVFGTLSAVAPAVLRGTFGETSIVVAGAVAFAAFTSAAVASAMLIRWSTHAQLRLALGAAPAGLAAIAAGTLAGSLALFVLGAVVTGAGCGLLVRAALAVAGDLADPAHRGEVLAAMFLAGYVGISAPVVLVGAALLVAPQTAVVVGFTVVAAAVIVATGLLMLRRT